MEQMKQWKQDYWHSVSCMKSRVEQIVKMADAKNKDVLEVGCNRGFVSKALLESGAKVTSCDFDPKMVEQATKEYGLKVIQADINKLPFDDGSFDIVVAGEVLEHIENPFIGLAECFRVAREKVVISVPVGAYWLGEKTHVWQIDCSTIEKELFVLCWTKRRELKDIQAGNYTLKGTE